MADMNGEVRVRIVGNHPWAGHEGILVAVQKPAIGILPMMGRIRLDDGPNVPYQHECFAESSNVQHISGKMHPKSKTK